MRRVGRGPAARAPVPLRLAPPPRAAGAFPAGAFVAVGFVAVCFLAAGLVAAGVALATTLVSGNVSVVGASLDLPEPFARRAATFANPSLPCPLGLEPSSLADRRSGKEAQDLVAQPDFLVVASDHEHRS